MEPTWLGAVDYHDHLFHDTPQLPGEQLDDETLSGIEATELHRAGIRAMVEATPLGLGRRPAAVARISSVTGMAVVHVTGVHHGGHYPASHWLRALTSVELTKLFVSEISDGMRTDERAASSPVTAPDGRVVRAGMVKAGAGMWRIDSFERRVMESSAAASRATGVPVMVHVEHGSAVWEILALFEDEGITHERVVLAHMDRNPDPGLHAELSASGAYLGYDGMARFQYYPESTLIACLAGAIERGGDVHRFVMGGDVARRSRLRAYGGMPGLVYLPSRFLPRLRRELGEAVVESIMVQNPRRLLTLAKAGAEP